MNTCGGWNVCPDCTDTYVCWRDDMKPKTKEKTHTPMHRCSMCTAAMDCHIDHPKCLNCENTVHMCGRCTTVLTCVRCTKRPHVCLSKCLRVCLYKKAPACHCPTGPRRCQVQKDNQNKGRYFWTCKSCNLFEWE